MNNCYMNITGPNDIQLMATRIDTLKEGILDEYIHMVCRCPLPVNFVWRCKSAGPGYYRGICPVCGTFIGFEEVKHD